MSAPHPSLRRLFALGFGPGRAVAAMDRPRQATALLLRELEGPLTDERLLEPLTRLVDGFAVLARPEAPPPVAAPVEPRPKAMRQFAAAAREPRRPGREPETRARRERAALPALDESRVAEVLAEFAAGMPAPRATAAARTERPRDGEVGGRAARAWSQRSDAAERRASLTAMQSREAEVELRRRAAAAGAVEALDTLVDAGGAQPAIVALLEAAAQDAGPSRGGNANANANADSAANAHADVSALERVLARVPSRRTSSASPMPSGSDERPRFAVEETAPPSEDGGLRGLVALAATSQPTRSLPAPPAEPDAAVPRAAANVLQAGSVIPPFVAERMQDERIAERVDRILRAEARRQGVDVDGVNS